MKLTDMRALLNQRDIQLTKSLGQNFLHDKHQLQRIVDAGEVTKLDRVLEIGPGLGPLTELLLERAGDLLAIELDMRLVAVLRERFPQLNLLHADALAYIRREPRDWSDWKLVANLPYSMASPTLVELALASQRPKQMTVTLQLEVAQRLMAAADDDDYGVLTLLVQLDYEPRGWFKIPADCFFPAPNVDSACVNLVRREKPLLPNALRPVFVRIVKRAFSQRRKMMAKLLKADWPLEKLHSAMAGLNLSSQIRAEKVSLKQFVDLARRLSLAEPTK
jgi:16S rRNA (adenine1518-N6/adenine1519-N6)-dimethyltransferase